MEQNNNNNKASYSNDMLLIIISVYFIIVYKMNDIYGTLPANVPFQTFHSLVVKNQTLTKKHTVRLPQQTFI